MAARDFFQADAKKKTAEVIKAIETKTSAEVVVAVRQRVGEYRATDLIFGFACACSTLGALWLAPQTYAVNMMPFEMLGSFVVGAVACAFIAPLRRLLTPKVSVKRHVDAAARSAFYDLGISKTHRRTGVLVFVALYEGSVVLLPDAAIPKDAVFELGKAKATLDAAVKARDLGAFFEALKGIGPGLAKALPRKAGDENELPDEPQ
jgi:putative membrane protein